MKKFILIILICGEIIIGPSICFSGLYNYNTIDIDAGLPELPGEPGEACIKYSTFYSSLIDWLSGPAEMTHYRYYSYDGLAMYNDVHSCAGSSSFPGTLPEGNYYLIYGNLPAIVNIKRIEDQCPYKLTYFRLTNAVSIPDANGTCVKSLPDNDKNEGPPDKCQQ